MFVLSHRLVGVPLLSLQTGGQIAETGQPIIDPRQLHIVAFYCEGPTLDSHPAVLHTEDIREASDIGIIIDDSDKLMAPDGLVRLQEVINFAFQLPGLPVVTEHGQKLGTVGDYAVDTVSFLIHKIHVKRPLLRSLSTAELVIDRTQIIEVTNKHIIVKSAVVEADEMATQTARVMPTALANPFRGTQAQSIERRQQN
jgi:uncharacterized protein YrrD